MERGRNPFEFGTDGSLSVTLGIAPEGFRGISLEHDVQVWFPIPMLPRVTTGLMGTSNALSSRRVSLVAGVARLPEGVSASQLVERLGALRHRYFDQMGPDLMPAVPEGVPLHTVRPAGEVALGDDQDRLRGRESEMGVRRAIGGVVLGILFSRAVLALLSRFTLPGGVALERLPLTLDAQLVAMISGVAVLSVSTRSRTRVHYRRVARVRLGVVRPPMTGTSPSRRIFGWSFAAAAVQSQDDDRGEGGRSLVSISERMVRADPGRVVGREPGKVCDLLEAPLRSLRQFPEGVPILLLGFGGDRQPFLHVGIIRTQENPMGGLDHEQLVSGLEMESLRSARTHHGG